ncbi:hypothetical protein BASA50_010701 [Batrachochytrium salamandrivorans]|uniref:Uncharacterized protein n=1 Tax=Batrachochytrium salamandrivorans TaxID=1357716 RepID=A0ABQ8EY61_9FUNG|nr:hypothetical protein BASA50_010701 [Batrachochytrium salamandrivorans]
MSQCSPTSNVPDTSGNRPADLTLQSQTQSQLLGQDLPPQEHSESDLMALKAEVNELRSALEAENRITNKLRGDLQVEKGLVSTLRADKKALKQMAVNLQATAEVEEEYISNTLMKRIQQLQHEKGDLLIRVEAEEEMITNKLQKKLRQLQKDKVEMECVLEKEQEFMVNRLQKQLDDLRGKLNNSANMSTSSSKKWGYAHSSSSSMSEITSPSMVAGPGVVEVLKAELNATKHRLQETEAANEEWRSGASAIYANIRQLALTLAHSHQACPHTDVHAEQVSPDSISSQFPPTLQPGKSSLEPHIDIPALHCVSSTNARNGSMVHSPSASPVLVALSTDPYINRPPRSLGRSFSQRDI